MHRKALPLVAAAWCALAAGSVAAAGTHGIDDDGVRFASWRGEARVAEATSPAELRLLCKPGPGGVLGWTLVIERAEELADFDFAAFDGPTAPARGQELATLGLRGGVLAPTVDTAVNGSRSEAGRFVFAWAADAAIEGKAALLADAIGPATNRLTWVLSQIDEDAELLRADFDLTGSAGGVRETMAGCGPVPQLPVDRLVGWQLAGAPVAEVLADRAVGWRLRAAVGRDWPEISERLGRLGPWRVDGSVLHAVADGPGERSGTALLIAGDSDAVEVLLLDDGAVRRYAGGMAALDPPIAVREFVESKTRAVEAPAPESDALDDPSSLEPSPPVD
jgi:hypothetical protein